MAEILSPEKKTGRMLETVFDKSECLWRTNKSCWNHLEGVNANNFSKHQLGDCLVLIACQDPGEMSKMQQWSQDRTDKASCQLVMLLYCLWSSGDYFSLWPHFLSTIPNLFHTVWLRGFFFTVLESSNMLPTQGFKNTILSVGNILPQISTRLILSLHVNGCSNTAFSDSIWPPAFSLTLIFVLHSTHSWCDKVQWLIYGLALSH